MTGPWARRIRLGAAMFFQVMSPNRRSRPEWALLVVFFLGACGGRIEPTGDGGAAGGSGGSGMMPAGVGMAGDGVDGGDFPICPGMAPQAAAMCDMPREDGCRYMGIAGGHCTTCFDFVCVSGRWQMSACTC